jgi:predicted RNase H-like nuclease (RuvC/YqgF family)
MVPAQGPTEEEKEETRRLARNASAARYRQNKAQKKAEETQEREALQAEIQHLRALVDQYGRHIQMLMAEKDQVAAQNEEVCVTSHLFRQFH